MVSHAQMFLLHDRLGFRNTGVPPQPWIEPTSEIQHVPAMDELRAPLYRGRRHLVTLYLLMVTPMRVCSLPTKSDQEKRRNRLKADWELKEMSNAPERDGNGISLRFDGTVVRRTGRSGRGLEMRWWGSG
jgi:hypothetical protein